MLVKINGKSEEVQGTTVLDLLKLKNIDPHMVAVELNSAMVERDSLGATAIKDGDHVEFLVLHGRWPVTQATQTDHGIDRSHSPRPPEPAFATGRCHDLWEGRILQPGRQRQGPDLPQYDQ